MKKRIWAILLALLLCAGLAAGASAANGISGECAWNFDETTGLLTISGSGSIIANSFSGNTDVTRVVIEEGIAGIGNYAFYGCSSLEKVVIKGDLSIGNYAFAGCASLITLEYWGTTEPTVAGNAFSRTAVTDVMVLHSYQGDAFCGIEINRCLGDRPSHVCGHLMPTEANAAICTQNGNTVYYTCSCGKYYQDEAAQTEIEKDSWIIVDPDAHDWNDPTYTQQGEKHVAHYVCKHSSNHTKQDDPADHVYSAPDYTCVCRQVQQFTIMFDTDGGSEVAPITQDYGSEVTAPVEPTKKGYLFAGWDTEIPATMPAQDLTIMAVWELIPVPDLPQTGDNSKLDLWTMLMGLMVAMLFMPKRREN